MKASHVAIVSIIVGTVLGVGMSWAKFHDSPPLVRPISSAGPGAVAGKAGPKVLVDARHFDFGAVERDAKAVHVFKITNLGDAPLALKGGNTTCSRCTIAQLEKSTLDPGETTGVRVEYLATQAQPKFRQHADILTDDPEQPVVELSISGVVTSRLLVAPQFLVLSKISANETKTAEVKIYAYLSDEVGVEKYEFTDPETAKYFEVSSQPIPRDQLGEPNVRSGCRVILTIKPGLPLGPIRQTIRLELKMADGSDTPVVEVPIEGTVDSDISIVGVGWNSQAGLLSFDEVRRSQGATRELNLVLRGSRRHDVEIKIGKVDPPWLKVTLGEPSDLKTGARREGGVTQIPLVIQIPPGSPSANYLGSDQGKFAEVILETTHPLVEKIRMYLKFVILQ